MTDLRTVLWRAGAGLIAVFMLSPLVLLVLFAFSDRDLLSFPITGLTLDWFDKVLNNDKFWAAFQNSLIVTGTVGVVTTVVGTMGAIGLTRLRPRLAGVAISVLSIPVMLPPLVLAVALSNWYATVGIRLGLGPVIAGHLVFTQPFVILIVHARLAGFDNAIVRSARDLGASPFRAFLTVTLPIVRPTIVGAALVAMALSLDDFILTFFTIGGGSTLPVYLWGLMRKGVNPQINVASLILITITIGASLIAMRATRYRG
ncbi:MAG: ABC transporter permease [Dongiaceae bacterium]|jgi:spermidine/putrescine transport system permease protein